MAVTKCLQPCNKVENIANPWYFQPCSITRFLQPEIFVWVMENLSVAHVFDYIVLRTNPGLTSCKDLATVIDK